MKKWILAFLVLWLCVDAAWIVWYKNCRITIAGTVYPRNTVQLDLRGTGLPPEDVDQLKKMPDLKILDLRDTGLTAEAYEQVRQKLPDCRILWSVPFQSGYLGEETEELTVTELCMEDLAMLSYFPRLTVINALECRDYEVLTKLKTESPDLTVIYTVPVGDTEYRENTREITLEYADVRDLEAVLPWLPELRRVTVRGTVRDYDRVSEMMSRWPDTTFVWDFDVCGVAASSLDTQLFLNDIPMENVDEVENALKYFYDLQWVEMCGCGISSEEMDALGKRHPGTRFVWNVQVGKAVMRTDITTLMPSQYGLLGANGLKDYETYKELQYCVDMVCMDLGHEKMTDFSFLANMPKLKYLILADTGSQDYSALADRKELVFLELFLTDFDQAEILTTLTALEDLNLSRSGITDMEPILEMDWLHRLWLSGNGFSDAEQQRIREALPNTLVVFDGRGCTDKGWRESPNYYAMRDLLGVPYMKD